MRITLIAGAASAAVLVASVGAVAATGPSSSDSPYLVPSISDASSTSLITVGNGFEGYRMAGIPDGLGAYDNGNGTFTVLMNHELPAASGVVRDHGAQGAFISKWTFNSKSLDVVAADDLVKQAHLYDAATQTWTQQPVAFNRLCSADLPDQSALFNSATGKGTQNKIFLSGEEAGAEGRAFAHVVTGPDAGKSYELPWMGNMSFENVVAQPGAGDKTVVLVSDDSTPGQLYVYIGTKQSTGNDVQKAGLANGKLYGIKVEGLTLESDSASVPAGGSRFSLVEIPNAENLTGAAIESASDASGVTEFARPEDPSWDPTDKSAIYVAMTGTFGSATVPGISRLWLFDFDNTSDPLAGGKATTPVQSPPYDPAKSIAQQGGPRMMDNITVNDKGQVLIQEDPGNNAYLAGIFRYDPKGTGDKVVRVFEHDKRRFVTGGNFFLTQDEESSGIIPVPFLGPRMYLADVQAHRALTDPELVEDGQLLLLNLDAAKGGTDGAVPSNVISFGKFKANKKRGTGHLSVTVPGPGQLVLAGKGVRTVFKTPATRGEVALKVRPGSKTRQELEETGRAKVTLKVPDTPKGCTSRTVLKNVKLVRQRS